MKKLKVWSCLVFAALGGITISGCAVMPNADKKINNKIPVKWDFIL